MRMDGYRNILRLTGNQTMIRRLSGPRRSHSTFHTLLRYLLCASQVQTLRSAERRPCRNGTALKIAVGRQLATTRTICDCRSRRFNFTFMSRTSFTAGVQNQWNTYSFPVSTSYLQCYRMKKKLIYFPYDLPSLWVWSHVVLHDHGVVEFCFNKYEKVWCWIKCLQIPILDT
jgi:hypothetical protein